jgi:gliding motility-associated-like protein
MRKLFFLSALLFITIKVCGQDFSNKGKDFFLCFPSHVPNPNADAEMYIYITSDHNSSGVITYNGQTQTFAVIANTITTVPILRSAAYIAETESMPVNKGIRVKVDNGQPAVVVYTEIYASARTEATLVLPVSVLGKSYRAISYYQTGNTTMRSQFQVVAVDTNTVVQYQLMINGAASGSVKTITLPNIGDVYQVQAPGLTDDLTGTLIQSVATGGGGCKKIAVFSGSSSLSISGTTCNGGSFDPIIQQCYPITSWGKNFGVVPIQGNTNGYLVRVMAAVDGTTVNFNGTNITLNAGQIYPTNALHVTPQIQPIFINADKPISVTQYLMSQNCAGGTGDPDMIILNPVEQSISNITIFTSIHQAITNQYMNVLIPTPGVSSFKVDGVSVGGFTPMPANPSYSYLKYTFNPVADASHTISSDSGFNAICYGVGNVESYGYSAGTNVKDLLTFITPINPLNISTNVTACTGTPFYFSVTLPKHPDSLTSLIWDYHGFFGTHNDTINAPLIADSAYLIGTTQVWRYKLNHTHSFSPAGIYPITITAGTVTSEGCGNSLIIDRELYVFDPPALGFRGVNNGCVTDSVAFTDTTSYPPTTYSYQWWWDFGDGNFSTLKNPKHLYTAAGTYTIRYAVVSNVGCLSDTVTRTIEITNVPNAKFGMSHPVCAGLPVTFSDTSSLVAPGDIVKWHWDFGDGFRTIRTTNSDTTHVYAPWNPAVTDTLTVETNTGCKSAPFYMTFKVNPIPVSNFTLPAGVCLPWDSAHFVSTSTIADATTGFIYSWDFGDPSSIPNNNSALPNPAHHYNNVGPFNIKLITTSAAGCLHDTTKLLSNIYLQAIAAFTVNPENCLNDVTTFTDNSNGSGNTVTEWYWDFGDGSPVNNTQSPTHIYATAGVKLIKHWVKTNASCYSDTATLTVIINPLPTANFSYNTPNCETRLISFTDASIPNAGSLSTWQWDFNDGSPLDPAQNPTHIFLNAGTYNVKLTVTTSKGCVSNIIKTVTINSRPLAGFIIPEVCLSDTYAQFLDTSKVALPAFVNAWEWNFGDASPLNFTQNPQHSYTAVGPYNVRLIATSNLGCKDTITQLLIVNGSFPVANFTINNPASLCANDSVAIVEASTVFPGNITKVEIHWDNINFPLALPQVDDLPFTGKVYKHLYLPNSQLTKTYQIRYSAYSGGVCVNDKLATITVNAAPKVQFNTIPDICYDAAPYLITQGKETGAVPGSFAYSGPGIIDPTGLFDPGIAGIGMHSIKYTFTSLAAGCVDSIRQMIKVIDTASAQFIFVGPVCDGTPATFKDMSIAPAGVTLTNTRWDYGDGSLPGTHAPGSTFTHAFPAWGTYAVAMYTTSAYGCKSTVRTQQVFISPIPQAIFGFNESSVCLPNARVSFINNSSIADGSSIMYVWDFGDPLSGPLNNSTAKTPPPHVFTATGPYLIKLTVTSSNTCKNIFSNPVDFIHPQPKAAFDLSKPEVCIGDQVSFNDRTNGLDGTVQQWYWDMGDGIKANTSQVSHLYSSAKTYAVSLYIINSRGCNSDTLTQQFAVHPYPVVDAGPDRLVLQGGAITILAIATGNDLKYLWSPITYLGSATDSTPVASNMLDDITYTLTVTGRGGCKTSDDVFVKVLKAPQVPNTFTPNGDGINEFWVIGYLDTYPDNRVQVFTRTGQLVFESRGYKKPWDGKLAGKPLPFDTYYYIIEPGNGRAPITGYVTIVK